MTKLQHAKKNRDKLREAERCINGANHPQPKIGRNGKRETKCERCKKVHREGVRSVESNTKKWMESA